MKQIIFITILVFLSFISKGQKYSSSYSNVGLQVIQPLDSLKYFVGDTFFGINAGTNLPIFNSGVEIGFDYSWARLQQEDREFVINSYQSITGQYIYENATMIIQNRNNRYITNFRFKPFNGKFQPYAELNCGFESYRILADVVKEGYGYSYASNSNFQYYDITYVTGWSAGIRVSSNEKLFVDFKFQTLKSGPVNYVKFDTFTIIDDENIFYEKTEITPKKFVYQVGLSYTY